MKYRNIIAASALFLAFACQPEAIGTLSDIQVSESYVGIAMEGGNATVTLTAANDWTVEYADVADESWLSFSPASGAKGEHKVVLNAVAATSIRIGELKFTSGSQTQFVNVIQSDGQFVPKVKTVAEAIELINSGSYGGEHYVKGTVCRIDEISTSYGNATYYISDDGVYEEGKFLEVYRGYWLDNGKFTTGDELSVGDIVTICGELTLYGTTPETVQNKSYVVECIKSLISVTPSEFEVGKDETVVEAKVLYSGDNIEFESDSDWLNVSSIKTVSDTTVVSIHVAANSEDSRTGAITLSSSSGKSTSIVTVTVKQAPGFSAYTLPYDETFLSGKGAWETVDVVPVEGVASIWYQDAQYGMVAKATKAIDACGELISPNIDLSGVSSAVLSFEHAQRFAGNVNAELTLFVSEDNGQNWTQLLIPSYPDGSNWTYVPSGEISLKRFAGKLIKIKFVYTASPAAYATWEIKNLKVVEGDAVITTIAGLNNSAVAAEAEWSGTFTDAIVTYVNGNNAFIEDATGGVQLYMSGHGLVPGMLINGTVSGKIKLYNSYAELTSVDGAKATVTTAAVPAPKELTLAQLYASYLRYQNCMVMLKGVTFTTALSESNRNGVVAQGDETIAAYSQVNGKVLMSGTGDLVCWPTRYNANLQLGCWDSTHFSSK